MTDSGSAGGTRAADWPTDPPIGIGTYGVDPDASTRAVTTALESGYRHVDTAEMYGTETAVGRAIDRASVDRDAVFVATKLQSRHLAYDDVIEHARACRDRLGVDTHRPSPPICTVRMFQGSGSASEG